jgi:amidohydrolase
MATELVAHIKAAAEKLYPEIVSIRQDLHQHPELSFQEERTSAKVTDYLAKHGIAYDTGWAGFGIVAIIKGEHEGPTVMLRADMDALPIKEQNEIPYKSVNEGIMHACGHDVHTSSLLGAAAILQQNKQHLHGSVKLIFQPGEEKLPGGASIMIKEGLFNEGMPKWILGQHVYPPLEAGHVGFRSGLYMASADEIYITIQGKGGHAATPHLCIDPIVTAARVVTALQEVVSRNIDPLTQAVLTVGKINSEGGATNVIPDVVRMEGTLRAMDENWRMDAHQRIKNLVEKTCEASGCTAETEIIVGYPCLINHPEITAKCRQLAINYLGADKVHELPQRMTAEDFAFYTHEAPASFYRLGTGWEESEKNFPVHSNRFNINEIALKSGMGLLAFITLSELAGPK